MVSWIRSILCWGIHSGADPTRSKRIVLTNLTSIFFSATIAVFAGLFFKYDLMFSAWFSVAFSAMLLGSLFLNRLGMSYLARISLIVTSNVLGTILCLSVGKETRLHEGFYVLAGASLILFETSDVWHSRLSLALSICGYFVAQWSELTISNGHELSHFAVSMIHFVSSQIYEVLIFLMMFYLSLENSRAEGLLKGVIRDLGEEKLATEALHRELEAQRAKSLQSAKLASLGEMAGGIAHEINSPLAAIQLNAEQLVDLLAEPQPDIAEAGELGRSIRATAQRISRIINGMRKISRDAEGDPFEPKAVCQIVSDAVSLCAQDLGTLGIRLDVASIPEEWVISCREIQISQVLLNLLNNAKDAVASAAEKWIRIEAESRGEQVLLSVVDSGAGVSKEAGARLFQPFFTTKEIGKGVGLGLSISRSITEAHRGTLTLDPGPGPTRFVMALPRVELRKSAA